MGLSICSEEPEDCSFEFIHYAEGMQFDNLASNINYIVYCQRGHIQISSTLFYDEELCTGEMIFMPRMNDFNAVATCEATLFVHKFNNTICDKDKCMFSILYAGRENDKKYRCSKLKAPHPFRKLIDSVAYYVSDNQHDTSLWRLKHKELIWLFTHYFSIEELRSFFHPMAGDHIPFRSKVMMNYRKAHNTEELAELCRYGIHSFRTQFKKEFGISVYQWLIEKRAENIRYRLSQPYISLLDIADEFNFSSSGHLSTFCKKYLGDTPTNIRQSYLKHKTYSF